MPSFILYVLHDQFDINSRNALIPLTILVVFLTVSEKAGKEAKCEVFAIVSFLRCWYLGGGSWSSTVQSVVQRILGAGATLAPPMGASGTTSAGGASPAVECTDGKIDSLVENQKNLAVKVQNL